MKFIINLKDETRQLLTDVGLLAGRLGFGLFIAFGHGVGKLQNYSAYSAKFPDPLGIGSEISMALAIFAELVCGLLITFGVFTRVALTQLLVTMAVAAFIVHSQHPLFAAPGQPSKEFALVYLWGFLTLILTGPGKFSIDHLLVKKYSLNEA
ncbi:MAG: DoxX family protein [Lentisphaerales bacterium]|nr:DoxX family protein [Lentisphaerales bacterium]